MASEKYLLDELPPDALEAFEEHLLAVPNAPWMCAQDRYSSSKARSR